MKNAFLSALSFLMIANNTIKSSYLLKNQYEMNLAILPRSSLSSTNFKNIWFGKMNLIHFIPVTFNGCFFGSSSVFIESNDILIIQNCFNLSGSIKVMDRSIFVSSTNLSDKFISFQVFNGKGTFQNSSFIAKSNEPVITAFKSEITIQNCNFSKCYNGGIVALQNTNLSISNSCFREMKAKEGAAVNFLGDLLKISNCAFINCQASKVGGALRIAGRLNSTLKSCFFRNNKSPQGNSIYLSKLSTLFLVKCSPRSLNDEIYYFKKSNVIARKDDPPIGEGGQYPATSTFSPTKIFTESIQFSFSNIFSRTTDFSQTKLFSISSFFTPSGNFTIPITPDPSQTPFGTPTPHVPDATLTPRSISNKNKSTKYLTFVIIICVAVVVIAIVAVVAILIQKRKSQIYPSDYDGENEEPKKTTVVISNINDDGL